MVNSTSIIPGSEIGKFPFPALFGHCASHAHFGEHVAEQWPI